MIASHSKAASGPRIRSTFFPLHDQFDGPGLGGGGDTGRVGHDEIDLPAGEREILVLEKARDALFEMGTAGGKASGLHRHQPDLDRCLLGNGRLRQARQSRDSAGSRQEFAAIANDSSWLSPLFGAR